MRLNPQAVNAHEGGERMTRARDIMTAPAEYLNESDTLLDAARRMAETGVGALPVCSAERRLVGMVTDRDIVIRGLATGRDPGQTPVLDIVHEQGEVVTIGADDEAEEVLKTMSTHKVRRLPVIDGSDLVGIVSQGDAARSLSHPEVGDLLEVISED
jgi:CBS domain-containing protein